MRLSIILRAEAMALFIIADELAPVAGPLVLPILGLAYAKGFVGLWLYDRGL